MYTLGVDLGTTYTAAAVARLGTAGPPAVELVGLGTHDLVVPTAVAWSAAGEVLVGEAASRRAVSDPGTVAREFKRRFGDATPVYLDGVPRTPAELTGRVLRWVVDQVAEREGEAPVAVALTCPAGWQDHRRALLLSAARSAGTAAAVLVTEPEAAAVRYASLERLPPGAVVGVYDLGGGTFDAAVVRRDADRFVLVGSPQGLDQLGGLDIDDLVVRHVLASLGADAPGEDDLDDPDVADAVALLRRDCVEAKEALSDDTETVVPVRLPRVRTRVRLTRPELEELVRPLLDRTVEAFTTTLDDAHVRVEDLTAVLLAGGASRMPLVVHVLTEALRRPLLVDAHPKHVVAAGAALWVAAPAAAVHPPPDAAVPGPLTPSRPTVVGATTEVLDLTGAREPDGADLPTEAPTEAIGVPPAEPARLRVVRRPAALAAAGGVLVLAAVLAATWATGASRSPSPRPTPTPAVATTTAPVLPTRTTVGPSASHSTSTGPAVVPTTKGRLVPTSSRPHRPKASPTVTATETVGPTESPVVTPTVTPFDTGGTPTVSTSPPGPSPFSTLAGQGAP